MSESASDRNVLDIAYPSVRQDDGYTCSVGPLSDRTDAGYVWQYWIPWMAMADRQQLQLHRWMGYWLRAGPLSSRSNSGGNSLIGLPGAWMPPFSVPPTSPHQC